MSTETLDFANVYEALEYVFQECSYVQKTIPVRDRSGKIMYHAAGEAAFIAALRPAMVRARLIPECHSVEVHQAGQHVVDVVCNYSFVHVPTGTRSPQVAAGRGMDKGDKATAKAMTLAYKYGLRQKFMIETGDDPDIDRPEQHDNAFDHRRGREVSPPAPPAPPAKPEPPQRNPEQTTPEDVRNSMGFAKRHGGWNNDDLRKALAALDAEKIEDITSSRKLHELCNILEQNSPVRGLQKLGA